MEIIKETKNYLVINKSAGLMVHGDGRSDEKTLCDYMLEKYPEIEGVGEDIVLDNGEVIKKPGIVHRLDRDTSGVMLIARTKEGFEYLKGLFKDRKVNKVYHAFVYGNIKEDEGVIDEPIGRSRQDFRRWRAGSKARGKLREAVTEYSVLKRRDDKSVTLIESRPKTGRTHQIRVHFHHVYHPLVGDSLYAPDRGNDLGFNRVALHSKKVSFRDMEGDMVEYEAEYPEDFVKALASFN